jgi:hypothetical protein
MFSIDGLCRANLDQSFDLNNQLKRVAFHFLDKSSFVREIAALLFQNQDLFGKPFIDKLLKPLNIVFFVHDHLSERFMVFDDIFLKAVQSMPIYTYHTVMDFDLPSDKVLTVKFASCAVVITLSFGNFDFMNLVANETASIQVK